MTTNRGSWPTAWAASQFFKYHIEAIICQFTLDTYDDIAFQRNAGSGVSGTAVDANERVRLLTGHLRLP